MAAVTQTRSQNKLVRFFSDQRKWTPYLFLAPFFLTFAVFTLYPMLRAITMAFQESVGYSGQWDWVGFENFAEIFTDSAHGRGVHEFHQIHVRQPGHAATGGLSIWPCF